MKPRSKSVRGQRPPEDSPGTDLVGADGEEVHEPELLEALLDDALQREGDLCMFVFVGVRSSSEACLNTGSYLLCNSFPLRRWFIADRDRQEVSLRSG